MMKSPSGFPALSSTESGGKSLGLTVKEIPCPLCGEQKSSPVMTGPDWYYGVPGTFQVVRCASCSHAFLNPCPVDEDLARCYPEGYSAHRSGQDEQPESPPTSAADTAPSRQPWCLASWFRRIPGPRWLYYWLTETRSQLIPPGPVGRRAVEIGCATGDFLLELQKQGWQVEGVELVDSAVRVARGRGLTIHRGDPTTVDLPAGTFDGAFAWMVVEHLPRPRAAIDRILIALKPGGTFSFSVPNFASWERWVWQSHWKGADLPRHLQHFTPRTVRAMLSEAGFEDVSIVFQPSFLNWFGSVGSWMVARNPKSRCGATLLKWFYDNPPFWTYLVFGPAAHFLAAIRVAGRMTIVARKPRTGRTEP